MTQSFRIRVIRSCATGLLVITAAACGSTSDDSSAPSQPAGTEASNPAAGPTAPEGPPPARSYTIVDFIRDNKLVETQLHPGDPGAPVVNLPMLPGWSDAGTLTPQYAWSAMLVADPALSADPPNIITIVSKLDGPGTERALFYAPGELKNMAGFDGPEGTALTVAGFNAWQRGGTFVGPNGNRRAIVQTTVLIPAANGSFVMQHNGDGSADQLVMLSDAMRVLNEQTSVTLPP